MESQPQERGGAVCVTHVQLRVADVQCASAGKELCIGRNASHIVVGLIIKGK